MIPRGLMHHGRAADPCLADAVATHVDATQGVRRGFVDL